MAFRITIGGNVLEKCIENVVFNVDTRDDFRCRYNAKFAQIRGKISTEEKTVGLYEWALLPSSNADCYKEITIEEFDSKQLIRKVKFSKAFVVDYSENYSNFEGLGTFEISLKQRAGVDIECNTEEDKKQAAKVESPVNDAVEEIAAVKEMVATTTTKTLKPSGKNSKVTDIIKKKNKPSSNNTRLPKSNGKWSGEEGNSAWIPDKEFVPTNKKTNPNKLSWNQISQKCGGVDRINFNDNKPDFSTLSRGTVEIEDFGPERYGKDGNFKKADKKLAEQRGCSEREVSKWRKKNIYTWHESDDCKTMYKVPNEFHGNIPHSGGISKAKKMRREVKFERRAFDE